MLPAVTHRLSGLELLLVLVNRVGNQKMSAVDSDKRLIMEAIRKFEYMSLVNWKSENICST